MIAKVMIFYSNTSLLSQCSPIIMGKTHRRTPDDFDIYVAPETPKYLRVTPDVDTIGITQKYKFMPETQHKIDIPDGPLVVSVEKRKLKIPLQRLTRMLSLT
jgi:hypothetical protein